MPIELGAGVEVHVEQPGMPTFRLPGPQPPNVRLVPVAGPAGAGAETLGPRVLALEETDTAQDGRLDAIEDLDAGARLDALEVATGGEPPPLAYLHTQDTPATVWLITHPLSFVPGGVEVLDHIGTRHYPVLSYPSASTVRLDFLTTVRGTARLS